MAKSPGGDQSLLVQREIGEIARGAGVGLGGNVFYYAVSYLFGILVARQIGAEEYGLYTLGVTAATLISRIAVAGMDRGLMRFASIHRGVGQGRAMRYTARLALLAGGITGFIGAGILWFKPEWILGVLRWTEQRPLLTILPLLAITIPCMTLTGIAIAGTQAFRTMRYRALVTNIIQPLLKLVVALALIPILGANATAPVLAFVFAQITGSFLAIFYVIRLLQHAPEGDEIPANSGRQLMRFSAPLFLSNVIEYLNGRTEVIVLGMFMAADVVGIYNAAVRLAGLGLIVLTAFNAIFSPVISDLHHRGESVRLAILFKLVTRWIMTIALPIFLIQILFAPQLMQLFGGEFAEGARALQWLSVGQMVNFTTGSVGIMLLMTGRSDITFINSLITVLFALLLDFMLVPTWGMMGAAFAGAAVVTLVNVIRLGEVWKLFHMHPFSATMYKPIIAAAIGLAVGLIWRRWLPYHTLPSLLAACMALGLGYLGVLLLLGLDQGDRLVLQAIQARLQMIGSGRRGRSPS